MILDSYEFYYKYVLNKNYFSAVTSFVFACHRYRKLPSLNGFVENVDTGILLLEELHKLVKSTCLQMFYKKTVLRNLTKFTGKHLRTYFLIKLQTVEYQRGVFVYFLKCMPVPVNFQILQIFSEHLFIEHLWAKKQPTEVSIKKNVLKNFVKLTEKHLCQNPF